MKTVADVLKERGVVVPAGYKIIFYNHSGCTSPIEVLPEDEYTNDYQVLVIPEDYPSPNTKEKVQKAREKGYMGCILWRVF